MARDNPAALLWINHKAKKIWRKKYGGKDSKPIKRPQLLIARSILRRKDELLSEVLFFVSSTRASTYEYCLSPIIQGQCQHQPQ